jgi:prevent-host-death family protein
MEKFNVAEAKSRFSELISRASSGERIIIQRREHAVAALIGTAELERLERLSNTVRWLAHALGQDESLLDKVSRHELHPAMAAFGLWRDDTDLENLEVDIIADRQKIVSRQVPDL